MDNCKTCRWFSPYNIVKGVVQGNCHKRSPVVMSDDGEALWPYVNETLGCGDHNHDTLVDVVFSEAVFTPVKLDPVDTKPSPPCNGFGCSRCGGKGC